MKATRKRIDSTHPGTDGCFFVCCLLISFLFSQRESNIFIFKQEEFKWKRLVKECEGWSEKQALSKWLPGVWSWVSLRSKQNNVTRQPPDHSYAIRTGGRKCRWSCEIQQSPRLLWTKMGGWQSRNRSRWSDCQTDSRYSKAADESCAYQKEILVQKKSSVIGGRRNFPDENVCHRRQGYLPKLVTKMCEMPTTFESSVVK